MRLLVLFDLPVVASADRRAYTVFRRFLLNDGYDMIQFSVYGRIVNGHDAEQNTCADWSTTCPRQARYAA